MHRLLLIVFQQIMIVIKVIMKHRKYMQLPFYHQFTTLRNVASHGIQKLPIFRHKLQKRTLSKLNIFFPKGQHQDWIVLALKMYGDYFAQVTFYKKSQWTPGQIRRFKTPDSSLSYRNINQEEIEALFGLLMLCSICKSEREKLLWLFAKDSNVLSFVEICPWNDLRNYY